MAVTSTTSSATANTGTTSSSTTGNAATARLISTYDTFLQLLTTQLKVQNPLEPMDAEKFTEQLVQYSAVEQQIQTNQKLTSMLEAMVSSAALSLINYIDKTVTVNSDTASLADGQATWSMNSSAAADDAAVTIRNSAGAVVYSTTTDLVSGQNSFKWDGRTSNGGTATAGNYTISIAGKDKDGKAVTVSSRVTGKVTAVDTSGDEPSLKVNGSLVPLSKLVAIGG